MPWLSRYRVLKVITHLVTGVSEIEELDKHKTLNITTEHLLVDTRKRHRIRKPGEGIFHPTWRYGNSFFLVTLQFLVLQPYLWKLMSSHSPLGLDTRFWNLVSLLPQAHMTDILMWPIRRGTVHLVSVSRHDLLQTGISMVFQAKTNMCMCIYSKRITFWEVSAQLIHPAFPRHFSFVGLQCSSSYV